MGGAVGIYSRFSDLTSAVAAPFTSGLIAGKRWESVFVLPNLVTWRPRFMEATCTLPAVLRALLHHLRSRAPQLVWGNAPLQGCDIVRLRRWLGTANALEGEGWPEGAIGPLDLRGLVSQFRFGMITASWEGSSDQWVPVDLGPDSLLEELYGGSNAPVFAVGDYARSWTASYHSRGRHVYVVNRKVLEADLIISVPKLKTHEKVGITCALKGTVGAIARKECLAHFRVGGPAEGGDEYPEATAATRVGLTLARRADESLRRHGFQANALRFAGKLLLKFERELNGAILGGAWHGNDTCWRMALDIARILRYAKPDGTLSDVPVRDHVAIVDGIVAGEGEGPLRPTPRKLGVIVAGADPCLVDYVCALVMGFDPNKIPIVRESFRKMRYQLTQAAPEDLLVWLDGNQISPRELPARFRPAFRPPRGWPGLPLR